jgi:uncharacterized membrane protein YgcG
MNNKPAHAVGRGRLARHLRTSAVLLVIAGYIATLVVAVKVPADAQVLPNASFGFLILAVVTLTVLVVALVRVVRRLGPTARAARATEDFNIGPWLVDLALVGVVGLCVLWMTAVIDNGGFDQRCIDNDTMTVVTPSYCEGPASTQLNSVYLWYYGGTGTQIGDQVQGGSLTDPSDDGGGGGSGGSGGDDGGDDGGDGGGDGGD